MKLGICIFIGYLLGTLNPAALIAKIKKVNLRKQNTGNLGATNTMLTLGKRYGTVVMLFDIAKSYIAYKIAALLCPTLPVAGMLAGCAAVVGHIFPFYLKFKGGKGLAAYGGLVLAADPLLFLILLVVAVTLMLIVNYSAAMPMSASILFPILLGLRTRSLAMTVLAAAVGILIAVKHWGNVKKAQRGEDIRIREYIKNHLLHG